MPLGSTLPRQEPDEPVACAGINRTQEAVESLQRTRYSGDLRSTDVAGSRHVRWGGRYGILPKTGGSTIAAMSGTTPGSGTITTQVFHGTTLVAGNDVLAYNLSSAAIPASTYIALKRIQDFWFIVPPKATTNTTVT